MKILFTADTHLGHSNIIKYTNRPFADVKEMDTELVKRWNEVVGPYDVVYHLGDFCLGKGKEAHDYFVRLNGQIKVLGYPWHHDRGWILRRPNTQIHLGASGYYSRSGHKVKILPPMVVLEFKEFSKTRFPKAITLCHYQLNRWDRRHYGSWHLFGHSHGKVKGEGLSLDIGVDNWNFYPVPLYKVAEILKERENEN